MSAAKSIREIEIQIAQDFEEIKFSLPKLKKLIRNVCRRFPPKRIENVSGSKTHFLISIAIVNDTQFRRINSRFLNRKSTSDCLSFDLSDEHNIETPAIYELIINGEMAISQANKRGHSDEAEMALYITHGLLHNLGFDDATPEPAKKMHDIEDEILEQNGYGMVYNTSRRNNKQDKKVV